MEKTPVSIDLDELDKRAKAATKGPWYMAGPPWLAHDVETYILSGSPDPHAGVMVCDMPTADMAGVEDQYEDDEWRARNDCNAAFISSCDPQTVLALTAIARAAKAVVIDAKPRPTFANVLVDQLLINALRESLKSLT
jgi:hypothetical protein